MPKAKTANDIDKVASLFPPGSGKMIERLLARAAEKEAKAAQEGIGRALTDLGGSSGHTGAWLADHLVKAVSQRGEWKRQEASSRQKAPDTGGRPYHFAHSTVSKADRAKGKEGNAAAHTRYIERPGAVEEAAQERDVATGKAASRDVDEGRGLDGYGASLDDAMSSVKAAQGYIENPVKLANGEVILSSFGTIGDTFDERVRFWAELEASENDNARVQCRLILELPHEATAKARHDMMRAFCKRFEDGGLPFWAALHAPGKDNDSRNFHCHVVYSEAPAKKMVDPADGATKWDFEITERRRDSSRHWFTRWPHKQNRDPFFRKMSAIKEMRKDFATVVNEVLAREAVKDRDGKPVLYDHRSYKDMGLDVVPMRSINRIVADKVKGGRLTVLDADYTRKMIVAEIRKGAANRDKDVLEMLALDRTLDDMARSPHQPSKFNKRLPRDMRASPTARLTRKAVQTTARALMRARHEALAIDTMERSTVASLERIIAAADGEVLAAAAKNTRDPVKRAELPDPAAAATLRAAAQEELEETRASIAKARRSVKYKMGAALNAWRELVGATPTASPPMRSDETRDNGRGPKAEATRSTTAGRSQAERDLGRDEDQARKEPAERPREAGPGPRPGAEDTLRPRQAPPSARVKNAVPRSRSGTAHKATGPEPDGPIMPRMPTLTSFGRVLAASRAASAAIANIAKLPKAERFAALDTLLEMAAGPRPETGKSPETVSGDDVATPSRVAADVASTTPNTVDHQPTTRVDSGRSPSGVLARPPVAEQLATLDGLNEVVTGKPPKELAAASFAANHTAIREAARTQATATATGTAATKGLDQRGVGDAAAPGAGGTTGVWSNDKAEPGRSSYQNAPGTPLEGPRNLEAPAQGAEDVGNEPEKVKELPAAAAAEGLAARKKADADKKKKKRKAVLARRNKDGWGI